MASEAHDPTGGHPKVSALSDSPGENPPSGSDNTTIVSPGAPAWTLLAPDIRRVDLTGTEVDDYIHVRRLGAGSFGVVWEARHQTTDERVAIKYFTSGDTDWEKLLNEVRLLHKVEGNRGIVVVKQVRSGTNGHPPFYVMQLANGGSLAGWLEKEAGKLSPRDRARRAVEFFTRIARTMAGVHRRGILHCDLKPQNILLHRLEQDVELEPLVADFGQGHLSTDETPALGTFFFMPPDQIAPAPEGTPPDTSWDVYALGAIAYQLLTGSLPRRTPELAAQLQRVPEVATYHEGVPKAPRPVAHHKLVDRQLGRIIDRCLSLNPNTRPRDAGALVALLDARERWHRNRPLLALAVAATLLVVGLIACAGITLGRMGMRSQEAVVTNEVRSCLMRTAGYGSRAAEDRLQRHIASLEGWADQIHTKERAVGQALREASAQSRDRAGPAPLSGEGLIAVRRWLEEVQEGRRRRAGGGHVPTLGLVLVSAPDASGNSHGYYVARAHESGVTKDYANGTEKADREFFSTDFSYRDWFHAGGDGEAEEKLPHKVVRWTHISQPFRSVGIDLNKDKPEGERERWKLNVVTPVWDHPVKRDRVIGLVVLGLDVEYDLAPLLHPREFDNDTDSGTIGKNTQVVLIDHRQQWAWHPDCKMGKFARPPEGGAPDRLPHDYRQLALDRELVPERACPWLPVPGAPGTAARQTCTTADDYVDLVESRISHGRDKKEIACFTRFSPYAQSRYGEDDPLAPGHPRKWVFVAQVEKEIALKPLDNLERQIVPVGAVAGGAMALLALALWGCFVRVLRRSEFAPHG